MEVRDRDALDVGGSPRRVSEPEARVEERPVREIAVDVLRPGRERQRQPLNTVRELYERLFYTSRRGHADRVSRRALQERPQSGQGHGFQVVAEPLYGLRPPLHVLLRAGLRAAVGTAV